MDDLRLARSVLDGDPQALRHLVERETGPLLRACARVLGDADEAADVVQETFMAAIDALPGFRGESGLRPWLLRIAVRRALRRRPARPAVSLAGVDVADDRHGEPDATVLRAERDDRLRAAVASLPEPYREVIVLRFFGELEPGAIADALGLPYETVRTRLRRSLERLRAVLAREAAA